MDSKELLNLIRFVAKAGVSEVKYKTKDFEINIKTPLAGSEAVSYVPQPVAYQAPAAQLPLLLLLQLPKQKLNQLLMTANTSPLSLL